VIPDKGVPILLGYGLTGDTKPEACNLLPDNSNGNKGFYGPGHQTYYPLGWLDLQKIGIPIKLQEQDSITGQGSNANTNEGAVLGAHFCFGSAIPYPDLRRFANMDHFAELVTITSAAAVTFNSGAATVYAAATNTSNWYDPEATYSSTGTPCLT
jgi:hypothetical protein